MALHEVMEELLERRALRELRLGGRAGRSALAWTACCEEMLTTAGASAAARSAKLSGALRAWAGRDGERREHGRAGKRTGDECGGQRRGAQGEQAHVVRPLVGWR